MLPWQQTTPRVQTGDKINKWAELELFMAPAYISVYSPMKTNRSLSEHAGCAHASFSCHPRAQQKTQEFMYNIPKKRETLRVKLPLPWF